MRDKSRIREICSRLAYLWETKCPDMRFGQLVENIYRLSGVHSMFYVEDNQTMNYIEKYFCGRESECSTVTYERVAEIDIDEKSKIRTVLGCDLIVLDIEDSSSPSRFRISLFNEGHFSDEIFVDIDPHK